MARIRAGWYQKLAPRNETLPLAMTPSAAIWQRPSTLTVSLRPSWWTSATPPAADPGSGLEKVARKPRYLHYFPFGVSVSEGLITVTRFEPRDSAT